MNSNVDIWWVYDKETKNTWTNPRGKWQWPTRKGAHQSLFMVTGEKVPLYGEHVRFIILKD